MSRTMGETEEKLKNDRSMMIFADVQQEIPKYLCMDAIISENGIIEGDNH